MIITFCGHSDYEKTWEHEKRVLEFLSEKVGNLPARMYLGGYGRFDSFAYDCCKKYKEINPNLSLVFVTPYITESYSKNHLKTAKERYDYIIFPDLEKVPPRFAISYRNRYMVECADYVIAYIERSFGGAYTTYKYACRKGKEIINLADNSKL